MNLQTTCADCGASMLSGHRICPVCVLGDALLFARGSVPPEVDRSTVYPLEPPNETSNHGPETGGDAEEASLDFLRPCDRPGRLGMLGHYEIIEVIGLGGMGIVFRAVDPKLHREVAIKAMKPHLSRHPAARERFLREARAIAAIEHENIITVHDVSEDRGVPFLAMRLLHGIGLQELLGGGRVPEIFRVLQIGRQIAEGLAAAHARGVIHRDIKPGNVRLTGDARKPQAIILDFGLARSAGSDNGVTRSGEVLGTPAYMAPEQAQGKPVDHRCDLFSLGCVLYQMTTGEIPFKGADTMSILMSLATVTPKPPHDINPAVPRMLSDLIVRLLDKDPAGRPQSARMAADSLAEIERSLVADANQSTVLLPASPKPDRVASPPRRGRLLIPGLLLLVLLPLGWFFGGTVVRFAANKGELVIDVQDPGIEVTVRHNGVELNDPKTKRLYWLTPGEGEIQVVEKDGVGPLVTRQFVLNRGGTTTVSVTMQELDAARTPPVVPPSNAPPRAAWRPGDGKDILPGLIPFPAVLPSKQRWQVLEKSAAVQYQTAQWSPDGRWLAVRSESADLTFQVRLYEGGSKRFVRVLCSDRDGVAGMHWSPDSRWLGVVRMEHVRFFRPDGAPGPDVATERLFDLFRWSSDSKRLLGFRSLRDDPHAMVMNPETGKGVFLKHQAGITDARWSPDGKWLATASQDKTARLWRPDGSPGPVLTGHSGPVNGVSWHPRDGRLATAGADATVRLWKIDGSSDGVLDHAKQPVRDCQWSRDGKHLASSTQLPDADAGTARLWDDKGKLVRAYPGELSLVSPEIGPADASPTSVNWRPDNKGFLVYRRNKENFQRYDVLSLPLADEPASLITDRPGEITWSPDGKRLIVWGEPNRHGFVRLFRLDAGSYTRLPVDQTIMPGIEAPASVSWHPDSQSFALGMSADHVRHRGGGGLCLFTADGHQARTLIESSVIQKLAISPRGDRFATGEMRGRIAVWKMDGTPIRSWTIDALPAGYREIPGNAVGELRWNPDGKHLVSCDSDRVFVWDADTAALRAKIPLPCRERPASAAFQPTDGNILAISGQGKSALWKWQTEEAPARWFDNFSTGAIVWSPDGRRFAAPPGMSRHARVWKADQTLESEFEMPPDSYEMFTPMAWNPAGTKLLVGSESESRVIDRSGKVELKLGGGLTVAWSADGKHLASFAVEPLGEPILRTPDGKPGPVLESAGCMRRHPWNISQAFTPDSQKLMVASGSRIAVWDVITGKLERIIVLLPKSESAVFSPAGEMLYATPGAKEELFYLVEQPGGKLDMPDATAFEKLAPR